VSTATSRVPSEAAVLNLKSIAARTGDLPPLPAVALKALERTKDPYVTAAELQGVISGDQALAAKILRIVNSPIYALVREVSTVSHAVAILGLETLRSIIMAASVQQVFQSGGARVRDLGAKLLSDHSWGSATACRLLAREVRYRNQEEAFLCGLMHDLGKPVLLRNCPEIYTSLINEVYLGRTTFHEAEMGRLGFSHAHVGALLAEKWNFPPQLSEAIGYHHTPVAAPNHSVLASITSLANQIMIVLGIGFERDRGAKPAEHPSARLLGISSKALDAITEEVRSALERMQGAVSF